MIRTKIELEAQTASMEIEDFSDEISHEKQAVELAMRETVVKFLQEHKAEDSTPSGQNVRLNFEDHYQFFQGYQDDFTPSHC